MTANEIRIEQAERRLYAILDRHTRLIEGLMKSMKPDDLEEDLQKNLKETNGMLDDCFWQFLGPLEPGDRVVSAYDNKMSEGTVVSIQKESAHKDYGSAVVEFPRGRAAQAPFRREKLRRKGAWRSSRKESGVGPEGCIRWPG